MNLTVFVDPKARSLKLILVTKPAVTRIFGRRATLKRSVSLLSDFRHEQTAPDIFTARSLAIPSN